MLTILRFKEFLKLTTQLQRLISLRR